MSEVTIIALVGVLLKSTVRMKMVDGEITARGGGFVY